MIDRYLHLRNIPIRGPKKLKTAYFMNYLCEGRKKNIIDESHCGIFLVYFILSFGLNFENFFAIKACIQFSITSNLLTEDRNISNSFLYETVFPIKWNL